MTSVLVRLAMTAALILAVPPAIWAHSALEGFGAHTRGGAGGPVVRVTSLADSGPGTLRAALGGGNRVIVFDVAGDIELSGHLYVGGANVTIDGFTAPPPGITLRHRGLIIRGPKAHDVIVRGVRVRGSTVDGIQVATGAYNVVLDRVSVSGSADGNIDITTNARDVTVSWSIVGGNGKNMLVKYRPSRITLHHNVLTESTTRSPQVRIDEDTTLRASETTADIRNNVVANWGRGYGTLVWYGPWVNVVNNYYAGADDALSVDSARAFVAGNQSSGRGDVNRVGNELKAFDAPAIATHDACASAAMVMGGAGVHPLDDVDRGFLSRIATPNCIVPVAGLDVDLDRLAFAGHEGSPDPAAGTLTITGTVPGLRWTASAETADGRGWLAVGTAGGTAPAPVAVFARLAGLGEGSYSGAVVFQSPDLPGFRQSVPVSLVVGPGVAPDPGDPGDPAGPGGTVWFPVAGAADDGREYGTSVVRLGQKSLQMGKDSLLAFRFQGVSVPRGAAITSAVLEFTAVSNLGRPIVVRYLGEAAGDSAPLVQQNGNLSGRAKTQAHVDEVPSRWVLGPGNRSAELRAVVQEIVDRADWAAGHALTLFVVDHGSAATRSLGGFESQGTAGAVVLRLGYAVR
jgi:hypothetical protein